MSRALVVLGLLVGAASIAHAKEPLRPTCNAAALESEALDSFGKGLFAQAFSQAEKALKCQLTEKRLILAVVAGCKAWPLRTESGQAIFKSRVKKYFDRLSKPNQHKAAQICMPYDDRGLFDRG